MKRVHLVIALSLLAILLPITAAAQGPGDVGIYFDAEGTVTGAPVTGFVPFQFYVLGFDLAGDVKGFELSVSVPAQITVLARNLGPGWLNVGSGDNFIVGTGGCLSGAGAFQLVLYDALAVIPSVPSDLLICIGPASPSSFGPPVPGYLECDNTLTPLSRAPNVGIYPEGCGIINPSQIIDFRVEAEIAAGHATAQAGEAVEVPVSVTSRLFNLPKTTPVPTTVSELTFTVSWDDAVANYENARLDDAIVALGWSMTATPQTGSVELSASGPFIETEFDNPIVFFQLELRIVELGGFTPLIVDPTSVNDGNTPSFGTPGSLTSDGVVPTRQESFGAVKARFGG